MRTLTTFLQVVLASTIFGTPVDDTPTLYKRQTAISIVTGVESRDDHGMLT